MGLMIYFLQIPYFHADSERKIQKNNTLDLEVLHIVALIFFSKRGKDKQHVKLSHRSWSPP